MFSKVKQAHLTIATCFILAASQFLFATHALADKARFDGFVLATSQAGGVYAPLGRSLCHIYNKDRAEDAPTCIARNSLGSVENIQLLREGKATIAIIQSDVAHWARTGEGPFKDEPPFQDLRLLFTAHEEAVTVVASRSSGIRSFSDLLNRRIMVSARSFGSSATTEAIFVALGWKRANFETLESGSFDQQLDAVCSGVVDAAVLVVGHPSGYVQHALRECGAALAPTADLALHEEVKAMPYFHAGQVEPGTYHGQDEAVGTLALTALVATSKEAPDQLVRAFTSTILAHEKTLQLLHPAFRHIDLDKDIPIAHETPRHRALATQ